MAFVNELNFAKKSDSRQPMIYGSCQCKSIQFELLSLPTELDCCYCSMCRKMHGSSVGTWVPILQNDIKFVKYGKQTQYKSSDDVVRTFCSKCGSNLLFKFLFQKGTIWIVPSLFDEDKTNIKAKDWWLKVKKIHIFCGSKAKWYQVPNDGHAQYDTQPDYNLSKL